MDSRYTLVWGKERLFTTVDSLGHRNEYYRKAHHYSCYPRDRLNCTCRKCCSSVDLLNSPPLSSVFSLPQGVPRDCPSTPLKLPFTFPKSNSSWILLVSCRSPTLDCYLNTWYHRQSISSQWSITDTSWVSQDKSSVWSADGWSRNSGI